MNRNNLKKYAPEARRDFIRAVTDRASYYGLTAKKTEPVAIQGDIALISGRAFPKKLADQRKRLEDRIKRQAFDQVMEAVAYTWFNRLVAIRFMELHGYLDHGYRVLSHPEGGATPEIVEHAEHVDLPGLDKQKVVCLKLEGTKEAELYRMLLIAQCNALHSAMPFLFERIDDETELLLPDNLLHSDSLIRTLVNEILDVDWQEVEIIGWLYQFYVSEKKDEVIGKVVKSDDIPAATQLFTPNWIVKYLVQNSLGRQWMATYPTSPLKDQMEFYIEPAEQTPEVQARLKEITPESLNPEELTLLDPACGSGHILVEAYDLLKAIYQERGYRAKDIPRLILEKNLFGLEIDDRAAQLAAFALMMKARADDQRTFERGMLPHVLAIQESNGLDASAISHALNSPASATTPGEASPVSDADIEHLLALFEDAKTLGSLIQIPSDLARNLPMIDERLKCVVKHGDLTHAAAQILKTFIHQAQVLSGTYDAVVANPPYIGSKAMPSSLKSYVSDKFPLSKNDLFAVFIEQCRMFASEHAYLAFVTPYVWMFLSSYERFRKTLLDATTITTLIQLEYNAFEPACVPVCCFTLANHSIHGINGSYVKLSDFKGHENQPIKTLEAIHNPECGWFYSVRQAEFQCIPGVPIAYWISPRMRQLFLDNPPIGTFCEAQKGLATCDSDRFVRMWWEVDNARINQNASTCQDTLLSNFRWYPFNKGGEFRRWFGNVQHVVNWEADGTEIKKTITEKYPYLKGNTSFVTQDTNNYFRRAIVWTYLSSSDRSFRLSPGGEIASNASQCAFTSDDTLYTLLAYLNSPVVASIMRAISPTLNSNLKEFLAIPFPADIKLDEITPKTEELVRIAKDDWDQRETSLDFLSLSSLQDTSVPLQQRAEFLKGEAIQRRERMLGLETSVNQHFLEVMQLESEIDAQSPPETCVLQLPDCTSLAQALTSYGIGCIMGRFSLDEPGLIYAHSHNEGFDPSKYSMFPADQDGIVPITDTAWFEDDAANRLEEFIATAWPREHLEENLKFVAESLGPKRGESPRDCIRRYLSTGFYKHHLSVYKKRPIYWLFSSGKQRAFQCLVYLHRYNEGTLARMRTEYVIPLSGKMTTRIEHLAGDIAAASSTSHRKKLEKERETLVKQRAELQAFDEQLRHCADQRIKLDLDDGVKVNYGKFGDLLAEVKAVTGGAAEEG